MRGREGDGRGVFESRREVALQPAEQALRVSAGLGRGSRLPAFDGRVRAACLSRRRAAEAREVRRAGLNRVQREEQQHEGHAANTRRV